LGKKADKKATKKAKDPAAIASNGDATLVEVKPRKKSKAVTRKTICDMKKSDFADAPEVICSLVADPKFVCRKCGRAAHRAQNLCKPLKMARYLPREPAPRSTEQSMPAQADGSAD